MSATRRVLAVNQRRRDARDAVYRSVVYLPGDMMLPTWRAILALERAAIACGVERERRRKARR